ncbi:hypothetical protein C3747_4g3547c [Trypanosoma cruzi]|uniref:Uncharacterized protein n=3 Tax=Trypanosoma cruzi TaxID=5693 RepID=Q4D2K4_TRYCC|nr:hypothetical protein, conserved [Trypanosoma cruzi]XP_813058.1 hypothetical protein, conserved [Trypanosoma cruzi]ESS69944.1 hypothetical protein TCDM_13967 [Trypanosoma cruzi Dm28c]PBJ73933.1 hypothetical protein BCY84_13380 [Trypanosoma cruzi cruzi]EAN86753.1 hypothetical protein, conserved [Trypanosoma cruzi]EAN91207.1 hypothetical protein, conserved [Trypanosoma cruzi]KAF8278967.1 hypothetical protein TcBrA4_0106950 [Trypanosoma cruzi]|eukprot:XP_808604.1 hypothetical protein [Trypanosoma cruzi strain CL Brener]
MEGPVTAVEQYFNQLINMRLLTQVVVSDRQGNTIMACFGSSKQPEGQEGAANDGTSGVDDDLTIESNVVLSGAHCFQNLEQLQLGIPSYISLQYHDATVVQSLDGCCMLTLIGCRSQGHFVGGLLVLLPQIRATPAYRELLEKTQECFQ